MSAAPETKPLPENIGLETAKISVELSTRFLEHFSEQLYSSPQKAFEELISNGWDAGADCVDVRIPDDLSDQAATMCVLDNGASMDEGGLRQLWHIAFSPKKDVPVQYGRHIIGKFGIGKLATYVLARKLTYICKAADGKIRRVTMDYGTVEQQTGNTDRLIRDVELSLYEVTEKEVEEALQSVSYGKRIFDLIRTDVPKPAPTLADDDFCAPKSALQKPPGKTWTLVVLSDLKPAGRELKIGILKRMLEAALPFGSEMAISVNDELLQSSKVNAPISEQWVIGPELGIQSIAIEDDGASNPGATTKAAKEVALTYSNEPVPHADLPGLGMVTGRVILFEDSITGGKSEQRGASNGFHVNVLGRVVNQNDISFGEENLNHAAWARFRMTVRADGLNAFITTDRERFKDRPELTLFRAFLRSVFNMVRKQYDNDANAGMPDGGDVLVRSLGVVSLNPLRNVVSEALKSKPPIPGLFDDTGIKDREARRTSWREDTAENIRTAVGDVKYESVDDDSLVKFRISDNSILVNTNHPFVIEHSRSRAEKELIRTIAMVNLLTDVYALDIGIAPGALQSVREYRDRLLRFRALQRRESGAYIAKLLLDTQHDSAQSKRLEAAVSDALTHLGFHVDDLATSGEPEGIASAFPTPTNSTPTTEDPNPPLYKFSFDAKTSKHDVAKTGNIGLDGIVEHRDRYKADYALVVAPGFSDGALATRCDQLHVTPMTAHDLGRLLEYTVEYGAIPVTKLREVFQIYDPNKVTEWVAGLGEWLKGKRPLTIDVFLKALDSLKGQIPDALSASTLALVCRRDLKAVSVKDEDVIALARGLSILVPDLVGVEGDKIHVNASSARVAAAVEGQLDKLREPSSSNKGAGNK